MSRDTPFRCPEPGHCRPLPEKMQVRGGLGPEGRDRLWRWDGDRDGNRPHSPVGSPRAPALAVVACSALVGHILGVDRLSGFRAELSAAPAMTGALVVSFFVASSARASSSRWSYRSVMPRSCPFPVAVDPAIQAHRDRLIATPRAREGWCWHTPRVRHEPPAPAGCSTEIPPTADGSPPPLPVRPPSASGVVARNRLLVYGPVARLDDRARRRPAPPRGKATRALGVSALAPWVTIQTCPKPRFAGPRPSPWRRWSALSGTGSSGAPAGNLHRAPKPMLRVRLGLLRRRLPYGRRGREARRHLASILPEQR